jgi:L-threonylcarbamoyladenylate synthase
VHIASTAELPSIVEAIPETAQELITAFWPGPLTIIFTSQPCVSRLVTCGKPTVAVRLPSHPMAQALIRAAGVPLAAPSANRSGRPSPTLAQVSPPVSLPPHTTAVPSRGGLSPVVPRTAQQHVHEDCN